MFVAKEIVKKIVRIREDEAPYRPNFYDDNKKKLVCAWMQIKNVCQGLNLSRLDTAFFIRFAKKKCAIV